MSHAFRNLLKQVGSGSHTSRSLSREEAASATRMMLRQEATPAQIGAFMIAHRIKRPTPEEMAGMLDAYADLGPTVAVASHPSVTILGCPYDGRSRSVPVTPIVALTLAAAGGAALLHGGDRMPTKEGLPLIEIFQALDVSLGTLTLGQVQRMLAATGFGFVYLPQHFMEAAALVPYREQIGKRPPFATLELMWSPYAGNAQTVIGYVHPPTEALARKTFDLRNMRSLTTVKGVEGSCELPRNRTAIIGRELPGGEFERLLLHPRDFGFGGGEVSLDSESQAIADIAGTIAGETGELMRSAVWSSGFYLWHSRLCDSIDAGLLLAERLLKDGAVAVKLKEIQQLAIDMQRAPTPCSSLS